jgi:hypothetical protein
MFVEYTINANPVASNGSCSSTGGILDPYGNGTSTSCNVNTPAQCQIGDLSGKHGSMPGPNFAAK